MIMDEPITPLLYRVNGLFLAPEHRVSTVVVVGGVGEWLDVADAVVTYETQYKVRYGVEIPESNQMLQDARFTLNLLKTKVKFTVGKCLRKQ